MIAAEIALAVVLLSGAGLFLSSFHRVASVDLGVDTDNVLSVRVRPLVTPDQPVAPAVARSRQAFDAIISRVRALSGVEAVALQSAGLPLRAVETAALYSASDHEPADYPYGDIGQDQLSRTPRGG